MRSALAKARVLDRVMTGIGLKLNETKTKLGEAREPSASIPDQVRDRPPRLQLRTLLEPTLREALPRCRTFGQKSRKRLEAKVHDLLEAGPFGSESGDAMEGGP